MSSFLYVYKISNTNNNENFIGLSSSNSCKKILNTHNKNAKLNKIKKYEKLYKFLNTNTNIKIEILEKIDSKLKYLYEYIYHSKIYTTLNNILYLQETGSVYKITNKIDNSFYIDSTIHKIDGNKIGNMIDIDDKFNISILEKNIKFDKENHSNLYNREKFWISKLCPSKCPCPTLKLTDLLSLETKKRLKIN